MDPLTLGMIALLIVVGYFMIFRPQQKRAKEQQKLQNSLAAGSRVMMSGGIFGTIRHLGEKQVIVEVSPGVELTYLRQAIIRPLNADEDEFEYADDAAEQPVEPEGLASDGMFASAPPVAPVVEDEPSETAVPDTATTVSADSETEDSAAKPADQG